MKLLRQLCIVVLSAFVAPLVHANDGSIRALVVPDDWQLIKHQQVFDKERKAHLNGMNHAYRYFDSSCYTLLKDWQVNVVHAAIHNRPRFQQCQQKLMIYGYVGFHPQDQHVPTEIHELLWHWGKTKALLPPVKRAHRGFAKYAHDTNTALGTYGAYYALFYNQFPYDEAQRSVVEGLFVNGLLYVQPKHLLPVGKATCNAQSLTQTANGLSKGVMSSETCGAALWAQVQGQLLLGLRLGNQNLFDKGIETLEWLLHFFDGDGIYVPFAAGKGAHALDYMSYIPHYLGVITELLDTLGYDFLSHEVPAGITVKQILEGQVKVFQDHHLLLPYIEEDEQQLGRVSWREDAAQNVAREQAPILSLYSWTLREYERWTANHARMLVSYSFEQLARQSARYIDRYRQDLSSFRQVDYKAYAGELNNIHMISRYSAIDPYMLYEANYLHDHGLPTAKPQPVRAGAGYSYTPKQTLTKYMSAGDLQSQEQRLNALSMRLTGVPADRAISGDGLAAKAVSGGLYNIDWYFVKAGLDDKPAKLVGSDLIQLSINPNQLVLSDQHFFPSRDYRSQLEIWNYADQAITMRGDLNIDYHGLLVESNLLGSLKSGFGYGNVGPYGDILAFMIHKPQD